MQPILGFTTEKDGCFLILTKSALANTENLLRQRNYAEGVGRSWVPLAITPFSGSFFTHALGQLMRAADLYFLTTAPQVGQDHTAYISSQAQSSLRAEGWDSQRRGCFSLSWLPDGISSCVCGGKELFNWSYTYRCLSMYVHAHTHMHSRSCMELFLRSGRTHIPGSCSYRGAVVGV